MSSHREIDARSLEIHRLIAAKLRRHPDLFRKVRDNIARFRVIVAPGSQGYIEAWAELVGAGMEVALAVATEDSEYGREMRQSSPFGGVLTHQERFAFLREWRRQHPRYVLPDAYPELKKLLWNQDTATPIPASDAFATYEREWRFVDVDALTAKERDLIENLTATFGHGVMNV